MGINMRIQKHGKTHKDYILFVLDGLKGKECKELIEKIDVFL